MATSKLIAKAAKYGARSRNDYVASAATHMYVGKRASDSGTYYSRLTMPALSSVPQIGGNRVNIDGANLWLYLNDSESGATTITVVGSTSSSYSATGVSTSFNCSTGTGWKSVNITGIVEAMAERTGDWYIHLRATGSAKRFDGTSRNVPYAMVDWEFVANTLRSSAASVALGSPVTFSITPESGDSSFTLTATIGDTSVTIASQGTATSYAWTPPLSLASEITNALSGVVTINMIVYDSAGSEVRREVLYQTVTVPTDTIKPTASAIQTALTAGFNGGVLTGETSISVVPVATTGDDYGADISGMTATCVNGSKSMTLNWTAAEMTEEPSAFTGVAKIIPKAFCASAGNLTMTLTVTDTRGITASKSRVLTVYAYSRPVINAFSVDRYGPMYDANEQVSGYQQDDVGDHVWVNIDAQISDVAGLNSLSWRIDGDNGTFATGTAGTAAILTEDRAPFPNPVGADQGVQYTLTVTDTVGNSAQTYSQVVPGRANFSLAGSKHGVGVGCIARGTEAEPLFEVGYPSQFYDAVHTRGVYGADGGRLDVPRAYQFAASDYGANFQPSTSAYRLHVFRSGPVVTLTGAWWVKTACTGLQTIVRLPDWATPCMPTDTIQVVQGYKLMHVRTDPTGIIQARYLSDVGTAGTFPKGQSMNVMMTWIAADAFALEPNLLLDSGRRVESSDNTVATYTPVSPLTPGEVYTLSLCVTPAAGVQEIRACVSMGNTILARIHPRSSRQEIYSATFTMPDYAPEDNAENSKIYICRIPDDGSATGSTVIHWIKVEQGARATNWTPAPEDFQ